MPIEVLMPALSPTMTEGTLAKWLVKEGDVVKSGKVIAEIETDKATMEVEAVDEGTVGKLLVPEGSENVAVNKPIAVLLGEGESLKDYKPANDDTPAAKAEAPKAEAPKPQPAEARHVPKGVIEVLMPALSPTMTEGTLAKWLVKEGDVVKSGKVIAEIETDKATMEVEAVDEGTVGKLLIEAGAQNVLVNRPIALLLAEGTNKDALKEYKPGNPALAAASEEAPKVPAPQAAISAPNIAPKPSTAPQPAKAPVSSTTGTAPAPYGKNGERVKASPLARKLAAQNSIDLGKIRGTGPKGRIIAEDIQEFAQRGAGGSGVVSRDPNEFTQIKNTGMRKVIAKRLLESKQQIPHFYLSVDCRLDELLKVRQQLNTKAEAAAGKGGTPAYKLSVNDLIIKATALAMRDVPASNASWYDDAIVLYNNVDVSVAVAIDGGLVTPVIKNADQKSLPQISNDMKTLAAKARAGKLLPEEMQGGGFSISNLGMFGIKTFSAIINPPQSCILAVGAGEERAVVQDGKFEVAQVMTVTLSVDHRSVDGAVGAQFLQAFKGYVEAPVTLFV